MELVVELWTASFIGLFTGIPMELWVELLIELSIKSPDNKGSVSSEPLQFAEKIFSGISVLTTLIK
jgi:hypothetical protein